MTSHLLFCIFTVLLGLLATTFVSHSKFVRICSCNFTECYPIGPLLLHAHIVAADNKLCDMGVHSKFLSPDYLLQSFHHKLSTSQMSRLKELGLLAKPGKRRGCRAGRHCHPPSPLSSSTAARNIEVLCSSHTSHSHRPCPSNVRNLITVKCVDSADPVRFSFAFFNAQSAGKKEKRTEIAEFVMDQKLDFVFIAETWFKPTGDEPKVADLAPAGYRAFSFPRSSRGGGIAAIYNERFANVVTFLSNFSFDHSSLELLQTTVTLPHRTLHFFSIYRPPPSRKNKLTDKMFLDQCPDFLEYVNSLSGDVLLVGDLNVHFDRPSDPFTAKVNEVLYMFDLTQSVKEPTHRCGHTLDCVIHKNDSDCVHSVCVTHAIESDHACIVTQLNVSRPPPPPPVYKLLRKVRDIDLMAFKADLEKCLSATRDLTADQLHACLSSVLDQHAPAVRRCVSSRAVSPWFGTVREEMHEAKRARRRAERQWVKSRLTVHKQIFIASKQLVTSIADNAKASFFSAKIATASTSKELFTITNMLMARVKTTPLPTIFPKEQLPSLFANYFLSKIKAIRDELDMKPSSSADTVSETSFSGKHLTSFQPVTCSHVRKLILQCSPKTCELDALPTSLLFDCIDSVLPAITNIFNQSLSSGVFPDNFKKTIVKPLLKKPSLDPDNLKNYRPISNLSFLSKVLERVVLSQLLDHLNEHNLLPAMQSAYRPHHSTETALLRMVNDILLALDQNHVAVLTLLDLSSAFDTIDHGRLIQRLDSVFGVTGCALSWLKSYLSDRTQATVIGDLHSDPVPLACGVPQGSVLGPVLFITYIQPLARLIDSHPLSHATYADDTQIHCHGPVSTVGALIHDTELCVEQVKTWMAENKLKLNDEKTEAVLLSPSRISSANPLPSCINICGSTIYFDSSAKSLGVTLDSSLSLRQHILNVCRNSYFQLRRIASVRHYLTEDTTKTLVCSFVLSQLDYCNSLLAGCPKGAIGQLQRVQNSAARLVCKARKSDHVTPLLFKLHWLPIASRIQYKILTLVHSSLSGSGPVYLSELLHIYIPTRQLRSSSDNRTLIHYNTRTVSFGQRSFAHQAPILWNNLPYTLRHCENHEKFKKDLKTHLFQTHFSS